MNKIINPIKKFYDKNLEIIVSTSIIGLTLYFAIAVYCLPTKQKQTKTNRVFEDTIKNQIKKT